MNNTSDNTYMATIPSFEADTHVQCKIIAYERAGLSLKWLKMVLILILPIGA
jgi:hypothetical protein